MKIRHLAILLLILSLALSFSACTNAAAEPEYALTVGDASVDKGVFLYFLDTQVDPYGEGPDKREAIANAEALCAEYVKINTEFRDRELQLSTVNKSTIASETDDIWRMYGSYYEKIGVGKDTVTKIRTGEMYKNILVTTVFGSGGDSEISDDKMKAYFNENYIFFRYFSALLSGEDEIDKVITDTFREYKDRIGKEDEDTEEEITFTDIYNLMTDAETNVTGSMETTSMKRGSDTFPQKFFTDVYAMKADDIQVIVCDDYVFMVQKVDGGGFFKDYKSSILEFLTDNDFDSLMEEKYGDVSVAGNKDIENDCYKAIKDNKVK